MKKCILFLVIIGMFSCSDSDEKTENPELLGDWELIEILSTDGDGPGVFRKTDNGKIVSFYPDGKIQSTSSICNPFEKSLLQVLREGTYSLTDNTIHPSMCNTVTPPVINFEIKDGSLIISYLYDEAYKEKYRKR